MAQDLPPPPSTQFGTVLVRQNDNLNTTTSITMSRGSGGTLRWEAVPFSSSRGDFAISFLNENDFTSGAMIASIAENGRDNSDFGDAFGTFYATVSVATMTGTDPPTSYFLATERAAQGSEVNVNVAFGYFPYDQWLGGTGWIGDRGNGLPLDRFTGSAGLTLSANLVDIGSGVTQLDLRTVDPEATPANGVVLVNHAKNEDNYASSVVQYDEDTGAPVNWRIHIRDNGANSPNLNTPNTEQDPVTFVYFPVSKVGTNGLQALGRVNNDATTDVRAGEFEVARLGVGTWSLKIPGGTPNTGTLLISPEGGAVNNMDNIVSFQWDKVNLYWVIQSRDIVNDTTLPDVQDGADKEDMFSFVFFAAPILPEIEVTSPTEGQVFISPAAFTVTARASDFNGEVTKVEFFRNGVFIGEDTSEPYTVEQSGLDGGRYIYSARATDNEGLAPRSTAVTAIVRTNPLNPPLHTALFFDGLVEHVATAPAPKLGVGGPPTKGLTLECWFRKEGMGATASSGVGGIVVQPLFSKGRGESDNNNTDTNYLVGITQEGLLAADFEAYPTPGVVAGGANFPIFGTHEPVQDGIWHHAAVTYDGEAGEWKLFLDGAQVATRSTVPGTMPRYDSNHRFAIGAALNTAGQRAGSFFGAIDEVRVWNYARSATDIASTKDAAVSSAFGLMGRFGLDEATGVTVTSSTDGLTGDIKGPVDGDGFPVDGWQPLWVPGAPSITNVAPTLVLNTPKEGEVFRSTTPILISATAADANGSVAKVEFFDGETLLKDFSAPPYEFLWSGGSAGAHVIRAAVTDNEGAISAHMVNVTLVTPPDLLLTELHSNPSSTAPAAAADYWELTNFGSTEKQLGGYTWHDSGRNRSAAQAWALPAGVVIAPGESIVFTPADPDVFRAWWGLPATTRVIQSAGAPGLGVNDGVALYDDTGAEVFYFSYAAGGFTRSNGLPSLGGHAGTSAGGAATEALVWDPNSGRGLPRYMAASAGVNGGIPASTGTDVGSPGGSGGTGEDPSKLLRMELAPAAFSEGAGELAAVGTVLRYGDVGADLTVHLSSGDTSEATVPASVVIPAGQYSATFNVSAVNDVLADGSQQVLLTGTATGVSLASAVATVQDDGDVAPPTLFLTEIHSSPSDAPGAADYWELTNYGAAPVNLSGFTWDDESRSFAEGQAWAFPNGTSIAAGESVIITKADPAEFRTWWGLQPSVQVIQSASSAPGLGADDGVALFDNTGRELFYVSYAPGGFLLPDGSNALGGHAGVSGGGTENDSLVWDVPSGFIAPRYVAAKVGVYQAFKAPEATDIGSPGRGAATVPVSFTLQVLHYSDAEGGLLTAQTAPNVAALAEAFEGDYGNTLIVSGGDSFLPGPFLSAGADASLSAVAAIGATAPGRPDIAIHNLIGVEASSIGHHEWDLGSGVLAAAVQGSGAWGGAQFPLLALNLDFSADAALSGLVTAVPLDSDDSPVPAAATQKGRLVPVTVVEKGGEKIGLVGVTTQLLASLSLPEGTVVKGGSSVNLDVLAGQIQPYVNELESEGVNKIVLLSHLGDLAQEQALAVKLSGVDIIVASGSGSRLGDSDDSPVAFPGHEGNFDGAYPVVAEDREGSPLLIVSTDSEHTYLGRLVVDFDLEGTLITSTLGDRVPENGAYAATAANVASAWGVTEANLGTTAFAAGTKGAQVKAVTEAVQAVLTSKDGVVHGYSAVYLEGAAPKVRSQETNLGNLTADANQQAVRNIVGGTEAIVSLKHAGGITGQVGAVTSPAGVVEKGPTLANAAAGKMAGGISQLDIENALRGNQRLMVFETSPMGLKALLEHGVSGGEGQVQFPQVGGVQFAWDPEREIGSRVVSIALLKDDGSAGVPVYKAGNLGSGMLPGAPSVIRVVTLNGLANGGAGYPMKANGENFRYVLGNGTLGGVVGEEVDYTSAGQMPANGVGEQTALAQHVRAQHGNLAQAYREWEVEASEDERIQNVKRRSDTVPPVAGRDSDGDGLSDLEEILLGGNPVTRLRVGERIHLNLGLYALENQTLKIVGKLPAGLTFNPTTGVLSGVLGGSAAMYDLQLQVLVGGKIVRTVVIPLVVEAFPARLLGNYEALLENTTDIPQGMVRVTVTQSGMWSATLDQRGQARRSAKGSFELVSGSRQVNLPMVFKGSRTTPDFTVQMRLDIDSPQVSGTYADGAIRGIRLATFGASPPTTRRMNVVLDAGVQDGVAYPAGMGWAKGTVTNKGAVNLAGELGDGQKITLSLRLGVTGQSLVWLQPYRNKVDSYFGGVLPVPNLGQPAAMSPALESGAFWYKAADTKELSYDAGFEAPLPVTAIATAFDPVKTSADLSTLLGLTASTLNVQIEGAGLNSITGLPIVLPTSFKLSSAFALTTFTPASGAAAWTGKINKADGGLTGTFTLPASPNTLAGKAAATGILIRSQTDGSVGGGIVRVPVPGKKGLFRTASLLLHR